MDMMSLLKTGSSMAWNAFLGDFIHDFIERKRDGKPQPNSPSSNTTQSEKVKPFLGLAILSHEEEYRFTKAFDRLDGDEQGHLAEFLLEYYIRPAQRGGLITKVASFYQYDNFLLLAVNRDSSSKKTGSATVKTVENIDDPGVVTKTTTPILGQNGKVVKTTVETSSTGSNRKTVTTDEEKEFYTPGGTESATLLKTLATCYRDGGMKAAEDYLRLNKMPTMDPEALKKVEDFIGGNFGRVTSWLETAFGYTKETILTAIPNKVKEGHTAFIEHTDNYAERRAARRGLVGKLSRLLN